MDGGDAAVAVEVDVIFENGDEAVVWLDAVEDAVDAGGDGAGEFEVEDVGFDA